MRACKVIEPMNLPIQKLLDDDLREISKSRKERGNYWYASEIGYCPRKCFFSRLQVIPDCEKDARTLRVFEVGKRDETFLLDGIVKKIGQSVGDTIITKAVREIECNNAKLNVHGRIDLYLEYGNNEKEIIETKSQSSRSFSYMTSRTQGASEHHIAQLWFYLYTMGVENGQIVYISKDDLRIVQYPIFLSHEDTTIMVLKKINFLNQNWEDKHLPEVKECWDCKYCDYKSTCQKIKVFDELKKVEKK